MNCSNLPDRWHYGRSVVLDGNFSAVHRNTKNPAADVPLADGHAFMVTEGPYKKHLQTAKKFKEVCSLLFLTHTNFDKPDDRNRLATTIVWYLHRQRRSQI